MKHIKKFESFGINEEFLGLFKKNNVEKRKTKRFMNEWIQSGNTLDPDKAKVYLDNESDKYPVGGRELLKYAKSLNDAENPSNLITLYYCKQQSGQWEWVYCLEESGGKVYYKQLSMPSWKEIERQEYDFNTCEPIGDPKRNI